MSKPIYSFVDDGETGFYSSAKDELSIVVGGREIETISMDEYDGSSLKSGCGVHPLSSYYGSLRAVSWVDGSCDQCKLSDSGVDTAFGVKVLRPEATVRLVRS